MAQLKNHEADGWIDKGAGGFPIVLVYGPDRGLVSERTQRIVAASGIPADDPFATIRFDAATLESDPGRLIDEANTVPMFGGRRLVRVSGAGPHKGFAAAVKTLADTPPAETLVIIEAGDLKKGSAGLRGIVEAAKTAIAVPCYPDSGRDLDDLINECLGAAQLGISLEARQLLKANLGGDRLASRMELDKLTLYCAGRDHVGVDDVAECLGDAAATSGDEAADAVIAGSVATFDRAFARFVAAGGQPFLVLAAAMRGFSTLQTLRHDMDNSGRTATAIVAGARPPVFFARRKLVESALAVWSTQAAGKALDRLSGAVLESRRTPALGQAIARQALLRLTLESHRRLHHH